MAEGNFLLELTANLVSNSHMVAAGIRSILNFAPTIISVPEGVDVRRVDLSSELQILAYHEQRKNADAALPRPVEEAG